MRYLLLLLISLNCFSRTTLEQILNNKPTINYNFAVRLANKIDQAADKYKVPANVLAAIAMQESSYNMKAINKMSNDYGLFQINEYNIKAYKINKDKLLNDLDYAVDKGAMVFQWFYKRYKKLDRVVKSYNCGTRPICVTWRGPRYYWKRVKKFM